MALTHVSALINLRHVANHRN